MSFIIALIIVLITVVCIEAVKGFTLLRREYLSNLEESRRITVAITAMRDKELLKLICDADLPEDLRSQAISVYENRTASLNGRSTVDIEHWNTNHLFNN